jgi:hypothetical protein
MEKRIEQIADEQDGDQGSCDPHANACLFTAPGNKPPTSVFSS